MDELYTILPERPVTNDELRKKILELLRKNPNQWYNVMEICQGVGFQEADKTKPTIRLACKELLHFSKMPIASCHAGFTYATQKTIMERFKRNMQERLQGMMRTLNDIDKVIEYHDYDESVNSLTKCMGAYDEHRWDKAKESWVCIRCGTMRKAR